MEINNLRWLDQLSSKFFNFLPNLIGALVVIWLGFKVVGIINKALGKFFEEKDFDPSLEAFLASLVSILLKTIILISAASMIGIETTSLVAILGAAGLAVGLALQGSMSNIAGGVLLLLFKMVRIGDYIEVNGTDGTVRKIEILNTTLTTPDNKTVIIPNDQIVTNIVTNYSKQNQRRVDVNIGISYESDLKKAKKILLRLMVKHKHALNEPSEPTVFVVELADSAVLLSGRVWVVKENYWQTKTDLLEQVKLAYDKAGIVIPYPQQDVHLFQEKK